MTTYLSIKREQAFLEQAWDVKYRTALLEMRRPDCEKAAKLQEECWHEINTSFEHVKALSWGVRNTQARRALVIETIRSYANAMSEVNAAAAQAPLLLEHTLKSA